MRRPYIFWLLAVAVHWSCVAMLLVGALPVPINLSSINYSFVLVVISLVTLVGFGLPLGLVRLTRPRRLFLVSAGAALISLLLLQAIPEIDNLREVGWDIYRLYARDHVIMGLKVEVPASLLTGLITVLAKANTPHSTETAPSPVP